MDFEFWLQFAGVVGLVTFSDVCWTFYFIKTAERMATQAAGWSAVVVGVSAVSTVAYVHDVRFVVAAMLGAFLGTFFTIKFFNNTQEE